MTNVQKITDRTRDGFISHADGTFETGLISTAFNNIKTPIDKAEYDVIIIGAGFAGLLAARELSRRGRSVLMIEARDRIGGRTFTAKIDNEQYEIGGTWIHWSQPHIWAEMTRYGFSLIESKGAVADHISILVENGSKVKTIPSKDLYPKLFDLVTKFSDVDGVQGRTVFPLPHAPLTALETVQMYDHLSMQDRLNQISSLLDDNEDMRAILGAYLSMNTQGDPAQSGFLDHLCFWALGDHDTDRTWEKTSRYKIRQGTSALAEAMFDDCRDVNLLLSTSVICVHRTDDKRVRIQTKDDQFFVGRTAIITIPLNTLPTMKFQPPLEAEKQRAIVEGQCRGGTKFWAKLEHPIGSWCGFAPYPNAITVALTDDLEGTIIVGFGPDNALDIQDAKNVESELQKFLPDCKVKYVFGHDWRHDPFVQGTWSWYKPGLISSNLRVLQTPEPPLFFASSDSSSSWRGCIDGALESGLTCVRQVQQYLRNEFVM